MILYGTSISPFVRKVLAYAEEKGIALELRPIRYDQPDLEFFAASPFKKMPALVDGDFSISDSTAIVTYLEAKFPTPVMLPADPAQRARVIWFEEFGDTVMSVIVFKCFFNRVVSPLFMKKPGNEALAVEGETVNLPPVLAYLESQVPEPDGFLVGESLTVADLAVATMFVNYEEARCAVDKSQYPRTYAWVAAMHARPSFAKWIALEAEIIKPVFA